jgi:uncharacterized protein YheU (UPF0270 family)
MNESPELIEIPIEQLAEDTLQSIVESFILREGTDYGTQDVSMDKKAAQVRQQLAKGSVRLVFDPENESCTLLTENELKTRKARQANSSPVAPLDS